MRRPTSDFIVLRIVEKHVPDGVRFVDNEGAPPQQAARQDVGAEILRRVSGNRVVTHETQELAEAKAPLRTPRHGQDRMLAGINAHSYRREPSPPN
jgi:hypothetical protein